MTEENLNLVIQKIYDFSGIKIAATQKESLAKIVTELSQKKGLSEKDYCQTLQSDNPDFPIIINHVTVNETYFFREQKQFDVLKNQIFPEFSGKKMNIWCGACSTGEEPISILAMALSCNVDVTVYASDIDDSALEKIRNGIYTGFSFREDGKKYHELLKPYYTKKEDKYIFKQDFISKIRLFKHNLKDDKNFAFTEKIDMIFLRNVFIYFDFDDRKKITEIINTKMNEKAYLFFSMNEIGCIDNRIIPPSLYKTNFETVYFFVKGKQTENSEKNLANDKKAEERVKNLLSQTKKRFSDLKNKAETKKNEYQAAKKTLENKKEPDLKQYFEKICKEINLGNFNEAMKITSEITSLKNKFFVFFLQGYIEYHADNKENAERLFSTAEMLQKDFWPAFFYHGMVLKDVGKKEKADFCFKKCKELLDSFGEKNPYDFVLDSFNPSYIHSICDSMIKA